MAAETLSPHLIEVILARGGPTFTPLSRQKYRCNQAPSLGKLSKHQCESLRRIMHPVNHHVTGLRTVPNGGFSGSYRVETVAVMVEPGSDYGSFVCPYRDCGASMHAHRSDKARRVCSGCKREMSLVVQTMPEAVFSDTYSVRCPLCNNLNSPVYGSGKRTCQVCSKVFYARKGTEYAWTLAVGRSW